MRLLFLTFYYEPDLCAGSFRNTALVKALVDKGVQVDVYTTLPNRYASYRKTANTFEESDNLKVYRINLPTHSGGMLSQIKLFVKYYFQVKKLVKRKKYDVVFASSSRLFTAFLGARVARQKNVPLYLDIRDIFVDTITNILPGWVSYFLGIVLARLEHYTFSAAGRVNLVSRGFENYFKEKKYGGSLSWFTNGIDEEFLRGDLTDVESVEEERLLTVLYAGNIGDGQGLHTIIPEFASKMKGKAVFKVIGSGSRLQNLVDAVSDVDNVEIINPVGRDRLVEYYKSADILFLHLNDIPAFEKVLPSKIFEYAALGKPILAGVKGYSSKFIQEEVDNSAVFLPGDSSSAIAQLNKLRIGVTPRVRFVSKFSRASIASAMADDILDFYKNN
ncbi:MAG: glycosyltransferase family 4 protein [Alishewanella agri]|nr:glycosyltransferase family 4 protein [Alishewanella agri]